MPVFPKMNYLILSLLWILITIVVNPIGNFPLNDDWAYSKDVFVLANQGHLEFVNWSAMTLVSQILLGSFVCKLFGFSFTLLRILTLIIGLIGVLTTYKILKDININERLALFSCILIIANPLFFSLSNTFMTDVYFFTFSVLSIFFFNRSFNSDFKQQIIFASIFAIIATLIRQIGIVIPISFAIVCFYKSNSINKSVVLKAFLPFILTCISLFLYNYWMSTTHKNLTNYFSFETLFSNIGTKTFTYFFYRVGITGMTLGLFLFPLLILSLPYQSAKFFSKENRLSLIFTVLFTTSLVNAWAKFPLGNIFFNLGLGPKLLKDAYLLHINNSPVLNNLALNLVRVFGFTGGILLFHSFFSFLFKINQNFKMRYNLKVQKFKLFSLIIIMLFFVTFIIPDFFYDRYLIQLTFLFIILILPDNLRFDFKKKISVPAILSVFLLLLFSVGATHDYLSWNRARWKGLQYLMTDLKKSPHEIDGGFEFNGWYQTAPEQWGKSKSWWFVDGDDYILAFGILPGYQTVKSFPYKQYIPFENRNIYILQKIP